MIFVFWYRDRLWRARSGRDLLGTVFLEILVPKDVPKDEADRLSGGEVLREGKPVGKPPGGLLDAVSKL